MRIIDIDELNILSKKVVDAIFKVHRELGPGLLENIYEKCLCIELASKNLKYSNQVALPVFYKGKDIGLDYRLDILVEDSIIIELKSVEKMNPVYKAQLLTYLKLSNNKLGFLVNFNVPLIKDGIKRIIN